ncbi:hypothetical protein [Azospirillum sp. ST 5-10]|uniref:hypothetical protein n=1 Tax=unclassified Azospirillum TaxID=2630922 RepID=UPI003F4A79B5
MIRRIPPPLRPLPLLLLPLLLLPPANAAAQEGNERLRSCLSLAETAPDAALERSQGWQEGGGGGLARLCQAMALFHKGSFRDAATRLEALVPELAGDDPAAAASLLGRAGWAWLRAGEADRAERAYGRALEQRPDDADLLIDRAIARAEAERYWDAVADLDAAIAKAPGRADAWLYRAAAHKALASYRLALDDVARALELRPGDPEAVLLRGNLKALSGNLAAARDDWTLVRRLTGDDAEAARAAAVNLERTAPKAPAQ